MLGEAALLCAAAQLESVNDARGVEDLLLFQASLTEIFSGDKTCCQADFCLRFPSWEQGGDKGGGHENMKWDGLTGGICKTHGAGAGCSALSCASSKRVEGKKKKNP